MFSAFDEERFYKAIEEKDYLRLKTNTVSSMLQDPTFARGETDQVLKILHERVPEIFEQEVQLGREKRLDKGQWDKEYFISLVTWFEYNFAESRIDHIREVGKVVRADTQRAYEKSMKIGESAEGRRDRRLSEKETEFDRENGSISKENLVFRINFRRLLILLILLIAGGVFLFGTWKKEKMRKIINDESVSVNSRVLPEMTRTNPYRKDDVQYGK